MQKNLFITQKVLFFVYATLMIVIFVYALGFMTDFKELFGQSFKPILNFHDDVLQNFNRQIFWSSIIGVVGFVCLMVLEVKDKVADFFALGFIGVFSIINIVAGIMFLPQLVDMKDTYLSLDFDRLTLAQNQVYNVTARSFDIGITLYLIAIVTSVLLIIVSSLNTGIYLKLNGSEIYE